MIKLVKGNLFEANVDALVNTVNCVGAMGKGLALQFRKAYPENYHAYSKMCRDHKMQIGRMFVFHYNQIANPKYIINFPTKRHWKTHSRLVDIEKGLLDLITVINQYGIKSIAIPSLGSGLGGLNWDEVKSLITKKLSSLTDIDIFLYEPTGSPKASSMVINTIKPSLTRNRAILIKLLDSYRICGYEYTMLEVQKLMYFLEYTGEQLKLDFVHGNYGPYAEKLHHMLQALEGHYLTGYGDRVTPMELQIIPNAIEEANALLENDQVAQKNIARIAELIYGFETPYSMELLATVHYVAVDKNLDLSQIVKKVKEWSKRKETLFTPMHIEKAYNRLVETGWIKPFSNSSDSLEFTH